MLLEGGALLLCCRQQSHVQRGSAYFQVQAVPELNRQTCCVYVAACTPQSQYVQWQGLVGKLLLACCRLHKTQT